MLLAAGVAASEDEAEARIRARDRLRRRRREVSRRSSSTRAAIPRVIDDYGRLPQAPDRAAVTAPGGGYVAGLDAELVGRAAVALGAGRDKIDDVVDPGVGITVLLPPGAPVRAGDRIFEIQHRGRGLEQATRAPDAGRPDRRRRAAAGAAGRRLRAMSGPHARYSVPVRWSISREDA